MFGYLAGRLAPSDAAGDLAVRQITFRRGQVTSARFAPDGQTVIYAGNFDGGPLEVYSVRVDTRESRPLGLTGAQVLGVSSSGEIALSLGHRYTRGFESTGTLARVPLGTAAPREVLESVEAADWAPDGETLVVVRAVEGRRRLEFPVGTVLHETGGWISNPRVSPDGRHVAFFDHPNRGDNVGAITVVDLEGQARILTRQSHSGLAWSPSGEELFHFGEVGGSEVSENTLRASDLFGRSRFVFQTLGDVSLEDIAGDGRILLTNRMWQRELLGRGPSASAERNLSWGDWSFPTYLSPDGETVLIEEQRMITDEGYGLFMRPTDGSPPVRLGDGRAYSVSPDGRWVLAVSQGGGSPALWLLPTGAGEARRLFSLEATPSAAAFLPDGERIVLASRVAEGGTQLYVHALSGGPPRAISPTGVTVGLRRLILPDGQYALANGPDGPLTLYPIDDGDPLVVPGTAPGDVPVGWQAAGRTLLVQRPSRPPAQIEKIDIETGEREPWKELSPPDPAGVSVIGPIHVSADGQGYVYSYRRVLDRLTVIGGLQ
jgi:Tol biopolymer transport system component